MKIWLIKEGEPLPCDATPRLMRTGILAQYLIKKGHDVIWWSSTFNHGEKRYRYNQQTTMPMYGTGKLILLHSKVSYNKNVSLKRIVYHKKLASDFLATSKTLEAPDIILCSYPTCDFAEAAVCYGNNHNVPVILDIRDLWPDIFERALPSAFKGIAKLLLKPLGIRADKVMKNATSIIAINESHLQWALRRANREKTGIDGVFGLSYIKYDMSDQDREKQIEYWDSLGVNANTWNICFMGTFSLATLDMETVICGFKQLSERHSDMRLILCGNGDGYQHYTDLARNNKNIVIPGWQNGSQIASLMQMGNLGLYPYKNLSNFRNSLTNKIAEYMAATLPVLTGLDGYAKEYIEKNLIGLSYICGDAESFSATVEALYYDRDKMEHMRENVEKAFERDFSANNTNRGIEELLVSICKNR
jgi:glycosyltransferase involved in cell wall biosynthesis